MSSRRIVDLRKKRTFGAVLRKSMPALPHREPSKRSPLRARRRRARVFIALACFTLLVLVAYAVSYASHLPRFSVQNVAVRGAEEIRESLLRAQAETVLHDGTYNLFSRTNVFLYPREEMENAIREFFPRVAQVEVSREALLATAVVISVEEREAFARWCTEAPATFGSEQADLCYVMDKTGLVFAPADPLLSNLSNGFVFWGELSAASSSGSIGRTYLPGRFAAVSALLDRLGQAGFSPTIIVAEDGRDFSVELVQGFTLRLSFGANAATIVRNLQTALTSDPLHGREADIEYIDLRFGNRVYYKLQGEDQRAAE